MNLSSSQTSHLSSPDLGSAFPTPGTFNKKGKSRQLDKDHSRNRLSHTSSPLYFAKSKRPAPTDLDGVGSTNRIPGGQPVPRRQRSLNTKGKSKHAVGEHGKLSLPTHCIEIRTWCSISYFCRRAVGSLPDESAYCGDKPRDYCTKLCQELQVKNNCPVVVGDTGGSLIWNSFFFMLLSSPATQYHSKEQEIPLKSLCTWCK